MTATATATAAAFRFRAASLNLAQRTGWTTRKPLAISLLRDRLRASAYLLQETDYGMAVDLALGLGWGTEGKPCWRTDENRNTILWDPKKYRDLDTESFSLTTSPGDVGDAHYRSVIWTLLEHRESRGKVWLGSSHLSNGADAGAARLAQAKVLAANLPRTGSRVGMLLGIDRNSLATSDPAEILVRAGLRDLTRGASALRSYPAGDTRTDGKQIDAMHGSLGITASGIALVDPGKATDHRAWAGSFTVTDGTVVL